MSTGSPSAFAHVPAPGPMKAGDTHLGLAITKNYPHAGTEALIAKPYIDKITPVPAVTFADASYIINFNTLTFVEFVDGKSD